MAASEALSAIYDASYSRLVAQLIVITGSQEEAEDAVQEAFVKGIRQGARFDLIDNPEAWLRTVAINTQRTRWHRSAVLRRLLPKVPGPVRPVEPTPERLAVADALARLKPEWRTVVVLHHLADQPIEAIATQLGLPVGTVKSRLARAREQLGNDLRISEEADHV
ncbi:RNA polymerase sigma24 factor [Knoellia sinensis KCTC 19936]|uniref:RNA polymerase sigma24 factor n=1 Tax=Knoellia sinensis KCTC 19936 TaxID=1385520 RepID=A0A0A0JBH2_9MICO|nr:sigma-70 family RNA polymerase sigma factor [Knoellia sinensis]KGN34149.1 RNA polymerase sigma24 factor [Knoellia sinensis KCTC 19936]